MAGKNTGTEKALALFHEGELYRAGSLFGGFLTTENGVAGARFRVWAPRAAAVSVTGAFGTFPMERQPGDGSVFTAFVPGLEKYDRYAYAVTGQGGDTVLHADPYARHSETRPGTASKLYNDDAFAWGDGDWLARAAREDIFRAPLHIYEVHAGSWRTYPDGSPLNYRELARQLIPYLQEMGYTHVEFLPLTEYPYDGSWGYQVTGFYAPTSRYGTPEDFCAMVDAFHRAGIGVFADWVPAHFPKDAFGLARFDGGPCYEDPNPLRGEHKGWGTLVFDFGRPEVQSFLCASALFWLEHFHLDGLRVDAVASMLYLDYDRPAGQWVSNSRGGRENLEAVAFLQKLTTAVRRLCPRAVLMAEESTAWPMVTGPVEKGGLGFHFKWNMGWMNDVLEYMATDPLFRPGSHGKLTFSFHYAFSENFILPLSHDEVVHGKRSLIGRMPGSYEDKFNGLRALYAYMAAHPGKKLLFMGGELGQFIEWNEAQELDWLLLDYEAHRRLQAFCADLGAFYRATPALWRLDGYPEGTLPLVLDDAGQNVLAFLRRDEGGNGLLAVCNFSPVPRENYCVGVPVSGSYKEVFNTAAPAFGGRGGGNPRALRTRKGPMHGRQQHISLSLPGNAVLFFRTPPLPPL